MSLLAVSLLAVSALPVFAKTGRLEAVALAVGSGIGFVATAALGTKVGLDAKMRGYAKLRVKFTGLAIFFLLFAISQLLQALYYLDYVDYTLLLAALGLVPVGAFLATLVLIWEKK